jgi:hypothetical protein
MLNKKALATLLAVLALSLLLVGPALADKDPPVHGADWATHDAAFLHLGIDDSGGWDHGLAVEWPCPGDCLWHTAWSSLLAGTSGTELADGNWDHDWTAVTPVTITEPGVVSDQDGYAQYEVGEGLVSQYSCAWEGYNFVLVAYVMENTSDAPVTGAYVGHVSDLDVAGFASDDMTAYDPARAMGYNCDEDEPYCVGLRYFTGISSYNNVDCCDINSDASAYAALSNGQFDSRHPATGYADVQFIMGAGPFSLAPGEAYLLGTAWVAGSSLADLQANADDALAAWLASDGCLQAPEEFVPEPGSVMLLGSGLLGLAGYAGLRLRKRS